MVDGRELRVRHLTGPDSFNLRDRTLAREHDEVATQFARELHARRAGNGHLCGDVNWKVRRDLADKPADAHILHDGRIHAGGDQCAQMCFSFGHLILEHERVERDVAVHAAPMKEFHELR